ADEWLDEENRRRLRQLFAGLQPGMAGYVMKQRSAHGPIRDTIILEDQVRLFANHAAVRWEYRVHEQILPAIRRQGGAIHWTDVVIQHGGYEDAELGQRKMERNLRLLEVDRQERPG